MARPKLHCPLLCDIIGLCEKESIKVQEMATGMVEYGLLIGVTRSDYVMATPEQTAMDMFLSISLLWKKILVDFLQKRRPYITLTETKQITELRTYAYSAATQSTSNTTQIFAEEKLGQSLVIPVKNCLTRGLTKLKSTISVLGRVFVLNFGLNRKEVTCG